MLLSVIIIIASCSNNRQNYPSPHNLRCEYQTNPIGTDELNPRFFWQLNNLNRGAKQTAYQIIVASSEQKLNRDKGDIWDSGKVVSDKSVHLVYNGTELTSRTKYFWKVRIWDKNGNPSSYSKIAYWETGLLKPDDWNAKWIEADEEKAAGADISFGKWIWHPTDKSATSHVFFRSSFSVDDDKNINKAFVKLTADDSFVLYINGKFIGKHGQWRDISIYDIKSVLHKGENTIAVEALNTGGGCGFVFGARINYDDLTSQKIVSDENWRCTLSPGQNWNKPNFSHENWDSASVIAEYGKPDWGYIEYRKPAKSYYFRKEFVLSNDVKKGRVYISGLGLYECWINGNRVGTDQLTPGWTRFPTRVQYQTYDVSDLLEKGINTIGVILGNGWWGSVMGGNWRNGPPRLICQLDATTADGANKQIISDKTWKSHLSPIVENSLFDGEMYDARLEQTGWDYPEFDDTNWINAKVSGDRSATRLVAQATPAMKVVEQLKPVKISEPKPGVFVCDFGQNHAGRIQLKVSGAVGKRIMIRHSEILNEDGTLNTDNYRMAKATDVYILKGEGVEIFEPRFTYRGFRYAEITGYPGRPRENAITSMVIHNNANITGTFSCSNPILNNIYKSVLWGQRSNMYSVPTDCPQRNERLGWTGDAQASAPTSCWNMNMARFYTKWMHDITDSQNPEGVIQNINPTLENKFSSPGWGDAGVIIPWTVYNFYGDTRIIEENYNTMKKWIEYMRRQAKDGLLYDVAGYGDWLSVDKSPAKPIGAAYYYYSTKLFAKMAAVVGRDNDAIEYSTLATTIAKTFNDTYADTVGHYPGNTQTAYILPLSFGLVPEQNKKQVINNLLEAIEKKDYHLSTGFMGTAHLLDVLTNNNAHDVAYQIAARETYPSWGYMVKSGSTTIWEHWNSNHLDEVDPSMNSFNHIALGSVGKWFFESLAGINSNPEIPGFKHIIIRPRPVGGLTWAEATYESLYGTIHIRWELKDLAFLCKFTIPANTSAMVYLPTSTKDNLIIFESGKKCFADKQYSSNIEGLTFLESTEDAEVFTVEAGVYEFKIINSAKE